MRTTRAVVVLLLSLSGCSAPQSQSSEASVQTIYWSDGDSGRIDGTPFRLANVDAPETGGVGARGGAKCESERALGYEAKEFMIEQTLYTALRVTTVHGTDRYDRQVIDLSANGVDVAAEGVAAGHLAPWPHKGRQSLAPKPRWCAGL